jgi:transcriptional regulator with XRE-family HTH domain
MYVLGRNIYVLRKDMGITQGELARRVGVSTATISNYENDVTHPACSKLSRLADALGVEVRDLFEGTVPRKRFDYKVKSPQSAIAISGLEQKIEYSYDKSDNNTSDDVRNSRMLVRSFAKDDASISLSGDIPHAYIYVDENGDTVIYVHGAENAMLFEDFSGGLIFTEIDGEIHTIDTAAEDGEQFVCGKSRIGKIVQ